MADITLTAAVRSNLGTLQNTANLISQTQERLSTGKKVNSALDNPNSFFTSESLNSRASDLSNLQDDIGQSVSTIEAADKGISAISKLVDAAKGKANQALQTEDVKERATYEQQYNELRTQIEDLAKDSGYKGKNLLGGDGNDLNVKFNEDGSSNLDVKSVDYTDLGNTDNDLTIAKLEEGSYSFTELDFGSDVKGSTKLASLAGFADGGSLEIAVDGDDDSTTATDDTTFAITADTTVDDLRAALDTASGGGSTFEDGELKSYAAHETTLTYTATAASETGAPVEGVTVAKSDVGTWASDSAIEDSLDEIRDAQLNLRAQASTFGTNLSVVTNRQDFTADLVNTLETGAGKLTLADTNLEGANLAALNTQNSIATTTLSLATQASQSVLQLIR
ncbi:flagellin N-terminal helical domain-containing protein [Pseudovibrio sp. Alg231-02]|uniref:flagellin N-terminal helical domain-containing protein n=1 Tax=Pseudovibrio sp. Alg231-02 TaxID=1922223 RepID=UPI000D55F69E|nr:flagellin [Pseudovibrio sp. Alg231-02]